MARCITCGASADPNLGLCFECFCVERPWDMIREDPESECSYYGHEPKEFDAPRSMSCFCGQRYHILEGIGI